MGLTNNGKDVVARAVGGDSVGFSGTNTSTTATTLADTGASFPASSGGPPAQGGLVGHIVAAGTTAATMCYGIIISNTATVLTVDQWHDKAAPETVATTPVTTTAFYIVLPGGAPSFYMGVTANATAFNATDATLAAEIWTSGGGIRRRLATWAHTTGTATYTIANTFTVNGSDTGLPITIAKIGIFQHFVNATVTTSNSGQMLFETVLSSSAVLSAIGDNVAITDTVTIS
jgi:hypothetical protein